MKKSEILTIILVLLAGIIASVQFTKPKNSIPEFADQSWVRYVDDTEYISYDSDGNYSYWCSCGNPVDNFDMCDTYSYNDKTKTITLNCIGTNDTIKVISFTDKELVLQFGKSERIFTNTKYEIEEEE